MTMIWLEVHQGPYKKVKISSRVNMREGDREVPELLRIYFTLGRFR